MLSVHVYEYCCATLSAHSEGGSPSPIRAQDTIKKEMSTFVCCDTQLPPPHHVSADMGRRKGEHALRLMPKHLPSLHGLRPVIKTGVSETPNTSNCAGV